MFPSKLPSTKIPKALGWFDQQIEHKLEGNLTKNSALVNSNSAPCFEIFTTIHSKLAMPLNREVVCLDKLHIWVILKCLEEIWRTCQSFRMTQRDQKEN
jgi:hypothetical protein